MRNLIAEISGVMTKTTEIYSKTIMATLNEDRRTLREMVRESNDLFYNAREKKYALLPTLQKLQDNYIEAGHFYVQVVDYISEMSKALVHITPSLLRTYRQQPQGDERGTGGRPPQNQRQGIGDIRPHQRHAQRQRLPDTNVVLGDARRAVRHD